MRYLFLSFFLGLSLLLRAQDGIFYVSLNGAIQQGQYDGVLPVDSLKRYGNFGLGSSHRIGTELVMINDTAYSIAAEGSVEVMPSGTLLPFAAAKFFKTDQSLEVMRPLDLAGLETFLDSVLDNNRFAAIRINGLFDSISYKCYLPQDKPYPPIDQAAFKKFDESNAAGSIVGFYTPRAALVLNNPQYHFHYINRGRSAGGHVMDMRIRLVSIEIDYADRVTAALPSGELLKEIDLDKPSK